MTIGYDERNAGILADCTAVKAAADRAVDRPLSRVSEAVYSASVGQRADGAGQQRWGQAHDKAPPKAELVGVRSGVLVRTHGKNF